MLLKTRLRPHDIIQCANIPHSTSIYKLLQTHKRYISVILLLLIFIILHFLQGDSKRAWTTVKTIENSGKQEIIDLAWMCIKMHAMFS